MASRYYRIYKVMPFYGGGQEEFSNVYRYSHPGLAQSVPQDVAVATLNALMQAERNVHSGMVEFTRGESANVGPLDGAGPTDVEVQFTGMSGTGPTNSPEGWTPETVFMAQLRVGKKRWLRKYIHGFNLIFSPGPEGVSFNFDTGGSFWSAAVDYGERIASLPVTVDGSTENIVLEAGNGTPADGPLLIDDRIRNHDVKY